MLHLLLRGTDTRSEEAFRKDYGRLAELRSLLNPDVQLISLTATATQSVRKTILAALNMEGCVQVIGNPNKANIGYAVVNIDHNDIFGTFSHIINDIRENNIKASKVLVFCRKKEHVKELYELFTEHLGPHAYHRPIGEDHVMTEHGSLPCIIRRLTILLSQQLRRNFVNMMVLSEWYFVQLLLGWVSM